MSLQDEIREGLKGLNIHSLFVNRESTVHGLPATEVVAKITEAQWPNEITTEHIFGFAKVNGLKGSEMAKIIRSYIKEEK